MILNETLNAINGVIPPPVIEASFTWSPSSHNFSYTVNGSPVLIPAASPNTAITFTAATQIDNDPSGQLSVIEYLWDFGDGILGYGNPVVHTYILANPRAFTVLRMLDNQGHCWFARQQMYIS